ncbi:lysozyme inhibitor LprI family protein [Marinobacter sp. KM021]|uniref:lysozyme inhibitor LprI family protein n=1 Tax=Marinobacter sp. KM021 TaxID=3075616 RepID=UPI003D6AE9AB
MSRFFLVFIFHGLISGIASASDLKSNEDMGLSEFQTKEVDEFSRLEEFDTVNEFQSYIDDYVQSCIDNTFINTKTVPCFVGYKIWDRELNDYYQKLKILCSPEENVLLLQSQRLWIQNRDRTIEINSAFLDWLYEDMDGTMFVAMRAGRAEDAITPMVKQRALLLKRWVDLKIKGQYRDSW